MNLIKSSLRLRASAILAFADSTSIPSALTDTVKTSADMHKMTYLYYWMSSRELVQLVLRYLSRFDRFCGAPKAPDNIKHEPPVQIDAPLISP